MILCVFSGTEMQPEGDQWREYGQGIIYIIYRELFIRVRPEIGPAQHHGAGRQPEVSDLGEGPVGGLSVWCYPATPGARGGQEEGVAGHSSLTSRALHDPFQSLHSTLALNLFQRS